MADAFQITHFLSRRVRTLSLGERMRCEVVAALLHRPKVLLADEPTIGLDIIAKNSLRTLIKHWQFHEKTTLMLTSHDLSDVEALCDRCILIDQGQKKYDGPLDLLKGDLGYLRNILVTTTDTSKAPIGDSKFFLSVKSLSPYTHLYEFSMDKFPMSQVIFALTEYYGEALNDLGIQKVSLEEVLEVRYARRD
jgi:ABC-2 type transport system ATP-binding protein